MIVNKNNFRLLLKYYAVIPSLFVLIFYALTLAPGILASDSGELAAVQYTLGIAHPTGYPLFTLLGYFFSHLPIPIRPITKLNFLTALWSALTVYVLIITIKRFLDNYKTWIPDNKKFLEDVYQRFELNEVYKIIISIFGGLVLGFSKTFWFNSLSVEVYSLHIFLFSLTFYFMTKAFEEDIKLNQNSFSKDNWFFAFIFLALGFTNHLSTLFIVPAFLFLYFYKFNFSFKRIKKFTLYSITGILIVSLIYLYIPLRAMMQPYLNWGNPVTFKDLIYHITGRLYHQFLFPTIPEYFSNVGRFLNTLTISFDRADFSGSDFSVVIIIALLGLVTTILFFKRIFYVLMLIFLTTVLVSSLYNIPDIDSYYLAAHFSIAIFAAFGFFYISSIKMKKVTKASILGFIFFISIYLEINHNYSRVDLSENSLIDDYTIYLLNSVEDSSIVLSDRSSFYFPSLYYQLVEGVRKNVVVVEYKLIQQKWYYNQLNRIHPEIIQLQDSIATLNMSNRKVYFSAEMLEASLKGEVKLSKNLELVPVQFLFRLANKGTYVESKFPDYKFKFVNPHLFETKEIRNLIINMLLNRSIYELINGKVEEAKKYLKKLQKDFPDYTLPIDLQKLIQE